ncbi:DUF2752 domain-containing protein [Sinomicrobium soli]|uniref:DUF2752 domain-containing protein n=1 Tax=Sinomicrobium sp. N-1-3-6 TaxID=2219864 RepID=UPI000DCDCEB9|nr:DUF2752 domain-containing protein [Sinomicrobium sp. N-1-3-6]RAV30625.1 hypothetical protein DN748_03790 [Sinomicrobium sp. N-1-3-6]
MSEIWHWLRHHLIPCPVKWLTGLDCPGCGFQRSLLALLQGNFGKSLELYPATIPLLLLFALALWQKNRPTGVKEHCLRILVYITGSIILVSYMLKVTGTGCHVH